MDIFNIFIPSWGFPPTPAASHLIQMMQGGWQPAMDCQDAPANLRRRGDDSRVSCNFSKNASAGSLGFKIHWLPVLSILTWECNAPDRVDMDMMGVVLTISRFFLNATHQRRTKGEKQWRSRFKSQWRGRLGCSMAVRDTRCYRVSSRTQKKQKRALWMLTSPEKYLTTITNN